jgi:hypothetical protein
MDLLHEIHVACNSRDADKIADCFHENATFYMASGPDPNGRAVKGKAAIRKVLADRFLNTRHALGLHVRVYSRQPSSHRLVRQRRRRGWDHSGLLGMRSVGVSRESYSQQGHLLEDRQPVDSPRVAMRPGP